MLKIISLFFPSLNHVITVKEYAKKKVEAGQKIPKQYVPMTKTTQSLYALCQGFSTWWMTCSLQLSCNNNNNNNNNCIQRHSLRFYTSLRCAANCLQQYAQVAKAQSCENHMQQHIERLSHATCCVLLGMKGQLSY